MDRCWNSRYQKLKIKRKFKEKSSLGLQQCSRSTVNPNSINKNTGNFKMDRFMKDVGKYGRSSTADEADCNGEKFCRNVNKGKLKVNEEGDDNHDVFLKDKPHHREKARCVAGKNNANRREGLFARGIFTKDFNKGLMPPSFSARLNEDLQKMIQLANRKQNSKSKTYPRMDEDIWKRITAVNNKQNDISIGSDAAEEEEEEDDVANNGQTDNAIFDEETDEIINTERNRLPLTPQKVEAEVQVSSLTLVDQVNSRTVDDLYLKFAHFVTRSLFNSGIDKDELRSYSESVKESLVQVYLDGLKESDQLKGIHNTETNSNDLSDLEEDMDIVEDSTITPVPVLNDYVNLRNCPSTSKSEEGSLREKFSLANDSQLSDDVIIQKPEKMYSSGIEYLKAVYGSSRSDSGTARLFSPVQEYDREVRREESFCSSYRSGRSSLCSRNDCYDDSDNNNNYGIPECFNSSPCERTKYNENSEPFTLQYFPGHCRTKYSWNDKRSSPCCSNVINEVPMTYVEPDLCKSPKYISLLPSSDKLRENFSSNLYGTQAARKLSFNGSGDCLQDSLLTLPKHVPPRRSPDIQYIPRKMF